MSIKQKDVQTILEFNGIVRNYVKMKRIESRVELNEEIIVNNTVFKPVQIIGELPNMYRVFNVEVKHNNGTLTYRQMHELHLIELRKRSQNTKQL